MTSDRCEHFSPLSLMVERLSGGRGSVKCEAAAGGGALAPHLTEPRPPDTIDAPKARCRLRRGGRVLLAAHRGPPTHRLAAQLDAVGVVNDAVQQGVGVSGIPDLVEPTGHRDLGDQDRRRPVMAVIDHLHQVTPLIGRQARHHPLVDDQQPCARQLGEGRSVPACHPGDRQVVQQPRQAPVQHREAVACRLMPKSAGDEGLAHPGRAGQQNRL